MVVVLSWHLISDGMNLEAVKKATYSFFSRHNNRLVGMERYGVELFWVYFRVTHGEGRVVWVLWAESDLV